MPIKRSVSSSRRAPSAKVGVRKKNSSLLHISIMPDGTYRVIRSGDAIPTDSVRIESFDGHGGICNEDIVKLVEIGALLSGKYREWSSSHPG